MDVAVLLGVLVVGSIVLIMYGVSGWLIAQRDSDDSVYDTGWGWLLPGGLFYKLGRGDDSPGERLWPYIFGGLFDGWLYNSGRERRRRELNDE